MFRKFKFEEELYPHLSSIPLSTQFKLDRAGLRLSSRVWKQLSLEERNVLCHLSVRSQGELDCYRGFVEFLLGKLEEKAEKTDPSAFFQDRALWENLARVPEGVYLQALRLKVIITPENWIQLDDMERYTLVRLSTDSQSEGRFQAALEEFLGCVIPQAKTAGAS